MTEGFQVPMLAWTLGVHTLDVEASPNGGPAPPAPNVIFQTRAQRNATRCRVVRLAQRALSACGHVRTFRVYSNCTGNVTL